MQLLHNIWSALLAPASFKREGEEWKSIGFQGLDPATDVRGGGLLAMECLEAFAAQHTLGLKGMLHDLKDLEEHNGSFYPVSTTAIVLCARLCDACGISAGMRGPIKPASLDLLLKAPPPSELARDLWSVLPDKAKRGGFHGLFGLMLADFHVRFVLLRASYMDAQTLVDTVIDVLGRRLAEVRRGEERASVLTAFSAPALVLKVT